MVGRRRAAAILLPGGVLPTELAYAALCEELGDDVDAHPKGLVLYDGEVPPPSYGLDLEIDAVLAKADQLGFESFHLVGYSGGGAITAAMAARHPERLLSIALLEPAWVGNRDMSPKLRAASQEIHQVASLPDEQFMSRFVQTSLAPGVERPEPPPGPAPPWMAKRPAGLRALMDAFAAEDIDPTDLARFERPVMFVLGALSNPAYYGEIATQAERSFPDFTLVVFEDRHHFDPPHRAEPRLLAERLRELWARTVEASPG